MRGFWPVANRVGFEGRLWLGLKGSGTSGWVIVIVGLRVRKRFPPRARLSAQHLRQRKPATGHRADPPPKEGAAALVADRTPRATGQHLDTLEP